MHVSIRWLLPLLLLGLATACSGSDDAPIESAGSPAATESTASTGQQSSEDADAYWQQPVSLVDAILGIRVVAVRTIDGDVWVIAARLNGAAVYRSGDGGDSWTEVAVTPPPEDGAIVLTDIVRQPGGPFLISARIESRCSGDLEAGDGFRYVSNCKGYRPVMFVSDDGEAWRRVEPAAMAPPDDAVVVVDGIAAADTGFLAVGTVRADDWHARLWSSPDGETWTLERELRDGDMAISGRDVLADGDTIVVLAAVHPCATPWSGSPSGWVLGTSWIGHVRVFEGVTPADVALRGPGEHPLAVEPADVDCSEDAVTLRGVPYPRILGAMVDGDITLVRTPAQHELFAEDIDPRTGRVEVHQLARLIDGVWQETEIDGFEAVEPDTTTPVLSWVVDVDGQPGLVFMRPPERTARVREFFPVLPDSEGRWSPIEVGHPLIATDIGGAAGIDGRLLVVGALLEDPFDPSASPFYAHSVIFASHLLDAAQGESGACQFTANGSCTFADLSTVEGYPDFEGRDLSGIDLAFSDLGEANFDGANLSRARMWEVVGRDASFVGANLTKARLGGSELGTVSDANLAAANLQSADLAGVEGAILDGAVFSHTSIEFSRRPAIPMEGWPGSVITWRYDEDGGEPYELSLAGIDLTDMTIAGDVAVGDDPILRITDLSGATLVGTRLNHVDLSGIDPASVDLTDVRFWNTSICPDGDPPDGSLSGSCVREG